MAAAGEENEAAPLSVGAAARSSPAAARKEKADDEDAEQRPELRPLLRSKPRRRLPLLSVRHVGKLLPTVEVKRPRDQGWADRRWLTVSAASWQDLATHRDWRLREWAIAVVPVLHTALQRPSSNGQRLDQLSVDKSTKDQSGSTELADNESWAAVRQVEQVESLRVRRAVDRCWCWCWCCRCPVG